jgi:hypothetical protein
VRGRPLARDPLDIPPGGALTLRFQREFSPWLEWHLVFNGFHGRT